MRLPQEIFAEALWLECNYYGIIRKEKLSNLLKRYNLKLKKEKTLNDIQLAFGRDLKNTFGKAYVRNTKFTMCVYLNLDVSIAILPNVNHEQFAKFARLMNK